MPRRDNLVNGKTFHIRRAGVDDAADLRTIEIECGLSPWTLQGYTDELVRPDSVAFVAVTEQFEAVGFIIGRMQSGQDGVAEIYNIGISGPCRRCGIGTELLAEFLGVCRNNGARNVWLEVRRSNHNAISFYRSEGFETTGLRPNFYQNPAEDARLMSLSLERDGA